MNPFDQYHNLLKVVVARGFDQGNRTPQATRKLPYGASMVFDMEDGFPLLTTKYVDFEKPKAEYLGFLRGYDNAEDFAKLGVKWWRKDANENLDWVGSPYRRGGGDMGRAYGVQWREWDSGLGSNIDQVQVCLDQIRNSPTSRRIIWTGWNPAELDKMCLPPCHMTYHWDVNVEAKELSLQIHQRSCDMFLGVPMNVAGGAFLLHLFAKATGLTPRYLTLHMDDIHIYHNHFGQVETMLKRKHYDLPALVIDWDIEGYTADQIAWIDPEHIGVLGYCHHEPLPGDMSTTTVKK